jgi:putative phosphoesterase
VSKVAIVTDVHGNVPALEAALTRISELGAADIYCGGDLVGYGPRPNEVCRTIEERGIPTIYGNYDYAIARNLDDCGCFYPTPRDEEIGQASVAWTLEHTDERSKRFMHDLPFDLRFELGGRPVRLVHGSPRKVNEYLLEDRDPRTFERIAQNADCDILLFGHTHKPWMKEYGGVLFVNCGSVGKPKDGDPRAGFALLEAGDGDVRVSIERVPYDVDQVEDEVRSVGLPPELAEQLVRAG